MMMNLLSNCISWMIQKIVQYVVQKFSENEQNLHLLCIDNLYVKNVLRMMNYICA